MTLFFMLLLLVFVAFYCTKSDLTCVTMTCTISNRTLEAIALQLVFN